MKRILIIIVVIVAAVGLYMALKPTFDQISNPKTVQAQDQGELQETQQIPLTDDSTNLFVPTQYTPKTYIPPKYDPFSNKNNPNYKYEEKIDAIKQQTDTPPVADFTIRPQSNGLAESTSGTVGTEFLFNANLSADNETSTSRLMVRWDFEGLGKADTYFSVTKSARHTYEKAGLYNVTLEVLDQGGNVSKTTKQIKIVENTDPFAYFSFTPDHGTNNTVITFNTEKSYDSQYLRQYLQYRFDWNSDGIWDTKLDTKNIWRHKFEKAGINHVTMQVQDPEGAIAEADADITITENTPPTASFTVETKTLTLANGEKVNTYYFDASGSSDQETVINRLQFRWDYNYTGENDIVLDTSFSTSSRASGNYTIPGNKIVRLQVKDEDGEISETFATLSVE